MTTTRHHVVRASKHVREPDGRLTCYYASPPRHLTDHMPPLCACGRTVGVGVWGRDAWDRWQEALKRRRTRARRKEMDMAEQAREVKEINWMNRLTRLMDWHGWDREQLGNAVGASPRTVEGWVLGYHKPAGYFKKSLGIVWRAARAEMKAQAATEARAEREETV